MRRLKGNIFRDIFNLIVPAYCVSCNESLPAGRIVVCPSCYNIFDRVDSDQKSAFLKRIEKKYFDELFIIFHFSELFQKLMHYFKYEGFLEIADYFAVSVLPEIKNKYDIIGCVPLHTSKKRERGFNQSEIIARKVCLLLGVGWNDVLERSRYTQSQTKLSRTARKQNMYKAFQSIKNVQNKSILLIDDVITTGATLNECARVLKLAGADSVDIIAMATPVDILQEKLESEDLP